MTSVGPFAPYVVLHDFLEEGEVAALLDYSLTNEQAFQRSRTRGGIDPAYRVSSCLRDMGALKKPIRQKIIDALPRLVAGLHMRSFQYSRTEMELVAHGDGAFYKIHVDTSQTGRQTKRNGSSVASIILTRCRKLFREARPVSCPSRRFADSRFAINCWIRCDKPSALSSITVD
jgi:Rps23 Pro-64 3,4-dihydroxylase Tpa1-like proline 4-hydroxylase